MSAQPLNGASSSYRNQTTIQSRVDELKVQTSKLEALNRVINQQIPHDLNRIRDLQGRIQVLEQEKLIASQRPRWVKAVRIIAAVALVVLAGALIFNAAAITLAALLAMSTADKWYLAYKIGVVVLPLVFVMSIAADIESHREQERRTPDSRPRAIVVPVQRLSEVELPVELRRMREKVKGGLQINDEALDHLIHFYSDPNQVQTLESYLLENVPYIASAHERLT